VGVLIVVVVSLALAVAGALHGRSTPRRVVATILFGSAPLIVAGVAVIDHAIAAVVVAVFIVTLPLVAILVGTASSPRSIRLRPWRDSIADLFAGLGVAAAATTGAWISVFQPLATETRVAGAGVSLLLVSATTAVLIFALDFRNRTTPEYSSAGWKVQKDTFWGAWTRMIVLGTVGLVLIVIIVVSMVGLPPAEVWTPVNVVAIIALGVIPLLVWAANARRPDWWTRRGGRASRVAAVIAAVGVAVVSGQVVAPHEWWGIGAVEWVFVIAASVLAGAYLLEDVIANALLNFRVARPIREPLRPTTVIGALVLGAFGTWIVLSHVGSTYALNSSPDPARIWPHILAGVAQLAVLVWAATMVGAVTDRPEPDRQKISGSVRSSMIVDALMGSWYIFAIAVAVSEVLCDSELAYVIVGVGVLYPMYRVIAGGWRGHLTNQRKRAARDEVPEEFITRLVIHSRIQKAFLWVAPVVIGLMLTASAVAAFVAAP
jgi:hypothetical protein